MPTIHLELTGIVLTMVTPGTYEIYLMFFGLVQSLSQYPGQWKPLAITESRL